MSRAKRGSSHHDHPITKTRPSAGDFTVTPSENPGGIRVVRNVAFPASVRSAYVSVFTYPDNIFVTGVVIRDPENTLHLTPGEFYRIFVAWGTDLFPSSTPHDYGFLQAEPEG